MTLEQSLNRPIIRQAVSPDIAAIGTTLAAAFHDDPIFTWCVPDPARRTATLPRFFELVTTAVIGHGETEVIDDGHAAALWVPPGHQAVAPAEAEAFQNSIAAIVDPDTDRTFAVMGLLDEIHPTTSVHRFLWFVGVQPNQQGHGLGSSLLTSMLNRCDRDNTPAYLDATSPDNRRLYERHGFTVLDEHRVDTSPPLWSMWRTPQHH